MKLDSKATRRRAALALAPWACAALVACGGGGGDAELSTAVAQGYAADATAMPVHGTDGLDSAAAALESALAQANASSSSGRELALALTVAGSSAVCANGGTVEWTVSGGTAETRGNGQLDAGESYVVTYTACGTAGGPVLDGQLALAVTAHSASDSDVTLSATALKATWAVGGSSTLNGSARRQTSGVALDGGGSQETRRITSSDVTLASTIGARQASYTLESLDWTIVRTWDAGGSPVGRSHQGTLSLAASTPRRPNATLQIQTQGATTIGSDGWVSQGGFVIVTDRNRITCSHGDGSVTLTLDLGNDGSVDRTWTLTRATFQSEAG